MIQKFLLEFWYSFLFAEGLMMTSNFSLLTSSFWMNVSPLKMESKFIVFRRPFNHHLEMLKTCLIYRISVKNGHCIGYYVADVVLFE